MTKKDYNLNENQMAFADFYLINNNAGEAYKQAYDPDGKKNLKRSGCYTNGHRLLNLEKVQEYLTDKRAEIKSDRMMEAGDILAEITKLATDPSVKPSDRLRALELLGKNRAMFTDKVDMNASVDVEVTLTGFDEVAD